MISVNLQIHDGISDLCRRTEFNVNLVISTDDQWKFHGRGHDNTPSVVAITLLRESVVFQIDDGISKPLP